ncbi:MAG TPA: DUF6600 domain-containing protein [Candidatus Limnocylindria bacterium]|nr:DUF6600 domain-containing protein [Candidatus Limnocylindria bacterium]
MDTTLAGRLTVWLLTLAFLLPAVAAAQAPPEDEVESEAAGPTPLRLGFTAGDVRFWRPGTDEWVPAQVNIPLAPGDQLATGHLGNVEIQTGPDSFLRAWGDSRLAITGHDDHALRIGVSDGYLGLDLRSVDPGQRVHVDTPHAAVAIGQAGYYRIDVDGDRTSVIARRSGRATVTAHAHTVSLAADHEVVARAAAAPLEPAAAPEADAWDRWSLGRTDTLLAAESARYVAPQVYGAAELDRYGTWREEPTYGALWEPRDVPAGWAPYSTGTWISDPGYGWTWVDTAPWGWAPYHHGRWVFVNGAWAWAPGPRVARAVYAPALVAFFGAPRPIGRPFVSWVALGWGEPLVPWWGRPGFIGRPSYVGWSGPRHWHRDRFHGRPSEYRNAHVRHAVVGMDRDRFGRDRVERAQVRAVDVSRLQPIREPRPSLRGHADGRRTWPSRRDVPAERPRERTITTPRSGDSPDGEALRLQPQTPRDRERPTARPSDADTRERPRDRTRPTARPSGAETRERPGDRERPTARPPDADVRERSRAREMPAGRPTELERREPPRSRAEPERNRPAVPRGGLPGRGATAPTQQWRRAGDAVRPPVLRAPDRRDGMRPERQAPANRRGGAPQRGRR